MNSTKQLPASSERQGAIVDQLRSGPKTAAEVTRVVSAVWYRNDPDAATERISDILADLVDTGTLREIAGGKFEIVPTTEQQPDDPPIAETNGAEPTGGPAESDSTEQPEMTQAQAPAKKRGRPKKAQSESNGAGKPEAPAPAAEKPKRQGSVLAKEEAGDHLKAIDRVEQELAAAKIGYEDFLNVRRMKRAALDVAKSERRRYSVHEGSNLEQIKTAQKAVDKATKQYNEAAANALEGKNKVASVEEKLSRTIAGEMPLFSDEGPEDEGDDE